MQAVVYSVPCCHDVACIHVHYRVTGCIRHRRPHRKVGVLGDTRPQLLGLC